MKRINSRQKGKRGEREAAAFLRSLGFEARRGQQFAGGGDSPDVVTSLSNVHIEVKFGVKGMDLGTQLLRDACDQAERECGGKQWVVLWKPARQDWRLTNKCKITGAYITLCGTDEHYATALRHLNEITKS